MIPKSVKIKNNQLPDRPGVYLMKNQADEIMYVGKATSLKKRVESYFTRPRDNRIQAMVSLIASIDYIEQPTAIEALFLEANLIKRYQPYYNVLEKDDKSFSYLVITNEEYPRPFLLRATDFDERSAGSYKAVYGPFKSARAVRASLDIIRKAIPWSACAPDQKRACFYYSIKQCPGVCVRAVSPQAYSKIIKDLMVFFDGKRSDLIKKYKQDMQKASVAQKYELAADLRNRVRALEHIQDVAVLAKDDRPLPAEAEKNPIMGRLECYDISNISGTSATASMVVFKHGAPVKGLYRKFKIRTVLGPDDYASMREVLSRRFKHKDRGWEWPDFILMDGGVGQINAALEVLSGLQTTRVIPVAGLAKGPKRDRDQIILAPAFASLHDLVHKHKDILIHARDEAHRFAIAYHRALRSKLTKK